MTTNTTGEETESLVCEPTTELYTTIDIVGWWFFLLLLLSSILLVTLFSLGCLVRHWDNVHSLRCYFFYIPFLAFPKRSILRAKAFRQPPVNFSCLVFCCLRESEIMVHSHTHTYGWKHICALLYSVHTTLYLSRFFDSSTLHASSVTCNVVCMKVISARTLANCSLDSN